jgi:hypothetical protein
VLNFIFFHHPGQFVYFFLFFVHLVRRVDSLERLFIGAKRKFTDSASKKNSLKATKKEKMDVDNRGISPARDRDRSRRSDRAGGSRFDNNDRDKSRERQNESRRIYISK